MVATTPQNNPRYAYKYIGDPANDAARVKTLTKAGPLVLAGEHMAARLMPEAFPPNGTGGDVKTFMVDMDSIVLPGTALDPELAAAGIHWALGKDRWAQLWADLDATGLDLTPIPGGIEVALPEARLRIFNHMMSKMSTTQRTLLIGQVTFDGGDGNDNPDSDTYYDYFTAKMLMRDGGGMAAVANMRAMIGHGSGFFVGGPAETAGTRKSKGFEDFTDEMLPATLPGSRDLDAMSKSQMASATAVWLRSGEPDMELAPHIGTDAVWNEIERRGALTAAERLAPLLHYGWRRAYAALATLWPNAVEGFVNKAGALATNLEISGAAAGLSPQTFTALETVLGSLLPFATSEGNEERTAEIIQRFKSRRDDAREGVSQEAMAQLQRSETYQALKTAVEDCGVDDYVAMTKVIMAHSHAAGLLFLNSKHAPCTFWKDRVGARTPSAYMAVLDAVVSVSIAGEKKDWGRVLAIDTGKKLLAGKFTLDWWKAMGPAVAKRVGQHTFGLLETRAKGLAPDTLFTDPERMRHVTKPARAVMEALGYSGTGKHDFPSLWVSLERVATQIDNLPPTCAPKDGMALRLRVVAKQIMQCAEDRMEAELASPPQVAKRLTTFVLPDGAPRNAFKQLDDRLQRVIQEVEDGQHGLALDTGAQHKDKSQRTGDITWQESWPNDQGYGNQWQTDDYAKPEKEIMWGSAAADKGICMEADGKCIAFGQVIMAFPTAPDLTNNCVACYAPGKLGRDKWCPTPAACWKKSGAKAHARPDDHDDSIKGSDAKQDHDWSTFTTVIAAPGKTGGAQQNGSDWRGGRGIVKPGKGGKGGGKGDGKGGRKGGGKGGGKGKGKGKGKGGKGGNQRFGRQWS